MSIKEKLDLQKEINERNDARAEAHEKHGRWVFFGDYDIMCSVCGASYHTLWLENSYYTGIGGNKMDGFCYCPRCGARLAD